jgi:hypothetical protein
LFAQLQNKTLQTDCDKVVDDLVSQLSSKQASYFLQKGYYFQGLMVSTTTPEDGATISPDKSVKPIGDVQTDTWTTAGITLPVTMPCNLWIDYYDGPKGKGYMVNAMVIDRGVTYIRSVNVGPETERTQNWTAVKPIEEK